MAINDASFDRDRQKLKESLEKIDPEGEYISQVPFEESIYVVDDSGKYELIGINSNFIEGKYIEIFIGIDLKTTLNDFDASRGVKVFYFNQDTIKNVLEIPLEEAKKGYTRPEWRRYKKYMKKNTEFIVKNNKYTSEEEG